MSDFEGLTSRRLFTCPHPPAARVNCQQPSVILNNPRQYQNSRLRDAPKYSSVNEKEMPPLEDMCKNSSALLSSEKNPTSNFNNFTWGKKTKTKTNKTSEIKQILQQYYLGSVVPPNCRKKSRLKTLFQQMTVTSWHSWKPCGQIKQQTPESTI